jgi:hypothetical protein
MRIKAAGAALALAQTALASRGPLPVADVLGGRGNGSFGGASVTRTQDLRIMIPLL